MTSERHPHVSVPTGDRQLTALLEPPPGLEATPAFDQGWTTADLQRQPYLSYASADPSVNWSDELEDLHAESSRTHFLDRWTRDAILERLGDVPGDSVIADIGCSTGFLLEDLRAAHPAATLVGIDLIGAGLEKAHRLVPSARLLRADCCELPIAGGATDGIVSANLLEHVPDDRQALREFARVLRPGARAVIVVPAGRETYDYYDRFLGHERRYAPRELAVKCEQAGLEVVEDSYLGSLLYPAFWLVKQRNRRLRGGLTGAALQQQVAADIAATNDSRIGNLAWTVERGMAARGLRLPFGIRSLVVARRPGGAP